MQYDNFWCLQLQKFRIFLYLVGKQLFFLLSKIKILSTTIIKFLLNFKILFFITAKKLISMFFIINNFVRIVYFDLLNIFSLLINYATTSSIFIVELGLVTFFNKNKKAFSITSQKKFSKRYRISFIKLQNLYKANILTFLEFFYKLFFLPLIQT